MNWKGIISATLLALAAAFLGFMVGGVLGGQVFTDSDMGVDRLANALGGAFVGILAGLALAIVMIRRLAVAHRFALSAAFVGLAALVVLIARLLRSAAG